MEPQQLPEEPRIKLDKAKSKIEMTKVTPHQLRKETKKPQLDQAWLDSAGCYLAQPRAGRPVGTGTLPTTTNAHQE